MVLENTGHRGGLKHWLRGARLDGSNGEHGAPLNLGDVPINDAMLDCAGKLLLEGRLLWGVMFPSDTRQGGGGALICKFKLVGKLGIEKLGSGDGLDLWPQLTGGMRLASPLA